MDRRDLLIRTIIGEANNEGDHGQAAVAHVIRNRMYRAKQPVDQIILAPSQFSMWNRGNPVGQMAMGVSPDDPRYQRAAAVVDRVFGGQIPDMTGGATHYYNPALASPDWGYNMRGVQQIGNHKFGQADEPGFTGAPPVSQPLVVPASQPAPYSPGFNAGGLGVNAMGPPGLSMPVAQPNYVQPPRNPVTGTPPARTDELGNSIDEYFEGKARRAPGVPTDPVYEQNLLRFLNDNPYGIGISSYQRDYAQQKALWDAELLKRGGDASLARKWVAPPGGSFHGKGRASDLSYENNDARDWAHQNVGKYNLAFPLGNEPWHVEPADARSGGASVGPGGEINAFANGAPGSAPGVGAAQPGAAQPQSPQIPYLPPQANPMATALSGLAQSVSQPKAPLTPPKAHDTGAGQTDFASMLASLATPPRPASAGAGTLAMSPMAEGMSPLAMKGSGTVDALAGAVDPGKAQIMPFKLPQQIGTPQQADPLAMFRR